MKRAALAALYARVSTDRCELCKTARMIAKQCSGEPITQWDVTAMVRDAKKALRPAPDDPDERPF